MNRPGGEIVSRPLQFIWIADCSGSMKTGARIEALNAAIEEAIPAMQEAAFDNPQAQVFVRAVKFSNGAQWHIAQPTPVADFKWMPLQADGETCMGQALALVADQLKVPPLPERGLPPVLVLISDGQPTDAFADGLKKLLDQPWGRKAIRVAVAIGDEADQDALQQFIGNPEIAPLQAGNAKALTSQIKWVSEAALKTASAPKQGAGGALAIPPRPSDGTWIGLSQTK